MRRPCKLSIYLTPRRPHFVPQPVLLDKAAIKSKPVTYVPRSCGAKSTVSAVVPQPAITSEVITPAMELKPCNAGVFTPSVAPKPFDAVKVTPPA